MSLNEIFFGVYEMLLLKNYNKNFGNDRRYDIIKTYETILLMKNHNILNRNSSFRLTASVFCNNRLIILKFWRFKLCSELKLYLQ